MARGLELDEVFAALVSIHRGASLLERLEHAENIATARKGRRASNPPIAGPLDGLIRQSNPKILYPIVRHVAVDAQKARRRQCLVVPYPHDLAGVVDLAEHAHTSTLTLATHGDFIPSNAIDQHPCARDIPELLQHLADQKARQGRALPTRPHEKRAATGSEYSPDTACRWRASERDRARHRPQ